MIINRDKLLARIEAGLKRSRIVALVGPRQCGKTTAARILVSKMSNAEDTHFFDLESPFDAARLENPYFTLEPLRGLIIIDEIQRTPALFPILRVLSDRDPLPAKFLILGSSSPDLLWKSSESLAGRVEFVEMQGFELGDVGAGHFRELWSKGGLPLSFTQTDADSFIWRENFITTFLERDLRFLGSEVSPYLTRRFWNMVAHYHGQRWNGAEIAGSLGISCPGSRRYLDLLTGAFMLRQLQPWHENVGKRQVKAAKVYLRDTGLLHCLLGIRDFNGLLGHPKIGASWEGFCIELISRRVGERNMFHWAVHSGPELDLMVLSGEKRIGFEFKCSDSPKPTASMNAAMDALHLDKLHIVYPGGSSARLSDSIYATSILDLEKTCAVL